jgi:2'-5' RNA ligase
MESKTCQTAVVLIPPQECWDPIQAIRRVHDRHVKRWMPHVTLLYPFRPREMFDEIAEMLQAILAGVQPFDVHLREFRHFRHGHASYTIWVAPEPGDTLKRLQAVLQAAVPDCSDVSRHSAGFTPHLSVGQVRGTAELEDLTGLLRESWEPLTFRLVRVSLIWRNAPPDDVFRVDRHIPLGSRTSE